MRAPHRRTKAGTPTTLDVELADLPADLRRREWMGRVEAAIFAAAEPVPREVLARLVGRECVLDDLIADIRDELRGRPYDLVEIAGGWQHRTRPRFLAAIRAADRQPAPSPPDLSKTELETLAIIAYHQPVTRARISAMAGKAISRDMLAWLRQQDFIATGPRLAEPGAPATYVTTRRFLAAFGLRSLRDLPDFDVASAGAPTDEAGFPPGLDDAKSAWDESAWDETPPGDDLPEPLEAD